MIQLTDRQFTVLLAVLIALCIAQLPANAYMAANP
jgi:uncharacterized membrane protein